MFEITFCIKTVMAYVIVKGKMLTNFKDKIREIQKGFMLALWFQAMFLVNSSSVAPWGRQAGGEGEPFHWAKCLLS